MTKTQSFTIQVHHSFSPNNHIAGMPYTKEFTTANAHYKYGSPYPIKHKAVEHTEDQHTEHNNNLVAPSDSSE